MYDDNDEGEEWTGRICQEWTTRLSLTVDCMVGPFLHHRRHCHTVLDAEA